MIEIDKDKNIHYDESKDFESQSEEFKAYVNDLYSDKVRDVYQNTEKHYPEFNEDGSVSYVFEDEFLNYEFVRMQRYPGSTSNRAINKLIYDIVIKK